MTTPLTRETFISSDYLKIAATQATMFKTTANGEGVEEIAIDHGGDTLIIGFNGRYLTEMMTVIGEEQKMTIYLKDEASPGLIKAEKDEDFSYVVMPMRIF